MSSRAFCWSRHVIIRAQVERQWLISSSLWVSKCKRSFPKISTTDKLPLTWSQCLLPGHGKAQKMQQSASVTVVCLCVAPLFFPINRLYWIHVWFVPSMRIVVLHFCTLLQPLAVALQVTSKSRRQWCRVVFKDCWFYLPRTFSSVSKAAIFLLRRSWFPHGNCFLQTGKRKTTKCSFGPGDAYREWERCRERETDSQETTHHHV